MLERVFADRRSATAQAIRPVVDWCERGGDIEGLRRALDAGMDGYIKFLLERPRSRASLRGRSWPAGGGCTRRTEAQAL